MNTPLTIGTAIIVLFLAYILANWGVLPSFSAAFYKIKNNWLFSAVLIAFSLCIEAFAIIYTDSILLKLAPIGLIVVAFAPRFKEKRSEVVHFIGAGFGISLGLLSLWIDFGLWWIDIIALTLFLVIKLSNSKNALWWGEIIAIFAIIGGLFLGYNSRKTKKK